uniref:EF-hand domain-containing protein n=1 Tax=Timema cristinae TaxID=61476 RepID=A0A7R9D6G4_TIMCR|nr:unnamed protein product [Timema cristinae]
MVVGLAWAERSGREMLLKDLLVTLSTLLRGSIYEKLRWTFKLYDINGDGCITRSELGEIVVAIHELMGRKPHQVEEDRKAREQVDRVFNKLDLNQDGVITIEEFIESCLKVPCHSFFSSVRLKPSAQHTDLAL